MSEYSRSDVRPRARHASARFRQADRSFGSSLSRASTTGTASLYRPARSNVSARASRGPARRVDLEAMSVELDGVGVRARRPQRVGHVELDERLAGGFLGGRAEHRDSFRVARRTQQELTPTTLIERVLGISPREDLDELEGATLESKGGERFGGSP